MKKLIVIATIGILSLGFAISTYASDWDTFGKVMAGVTGLRVITGGQVDIVGGIFGIGGETYYSPEDYRCYRYYSSRYGYYFRCYPRDYYWSSGGIYYYRYGVPTYRRKVIIRGRHKKRKGHHYYRKDHDRNNKGRGSDIRSGNRRDRGNSRQGKSGNRQGKGGSRQGRGGRRQRRR